jgi:hypothetical protein
MPSNAASCESIPEENKGSERQLNKTTTPSHATELLSTASKSGVASKENKRPWSISDTHYEDTADVEYWLQVRDYMPPLYWAGRFQSRYDQWRTEAMKAHLDPEHTTEGQLAKCTLDQENLAACLVLAQLRDLCLTESAADSLWVRDHNLWCSRKSEIWYFYQVFEYKYRKDHQLLGNPAYPLHPPRKQDNQTTPKGAFGRAVRKLTPRKSSFVNLLKGKGWSKGDEEKPDDVREQSVEISPHSS